MELTVNGEARPCAMSAFTLVIYEQEFGGADLVSDTSGKVTADEVIEEVGEKDLADIVLVDFTKVPWLKVMQAGWAMLKTADNNVPHFEEWSRTVTAIDAWEFRDVVDKAVNDAFFHDASSVG